MEKSKLLLLSKKLRELSIELRQMAESEPQLFEEKFKEKIVARNKKSREKFLDAQDVIGAWALQWKARYGTTPIPQIWWATKHVAPLLTRSDVSKEKLIKAVKVYFETQDNWVDNNKHDFIYFIRNINKYLTGEVREEVYE